MIAENRDAERTVNRIRELYDELLMCGLPVSEEFGPTGIADDEIDRLALAEGVSEVPVAVREVLRLIGLNPGDFVKFGFFGRYVMGEDVKLEVLDCLSFWTGDGDRMADPHRMLVFMAYENQYFVAVDGTMLDHPDPGLWGISEDGQSIRLSSVTTYFAHMCDVLKQDLPDESV